MPIIRSLADLDIYKLTMLQVAWDRHSDVRVKFSFTNRTTDVRLADIVPVERLREELDHIRTLRFTREELAYLETLDLFDTSFLFWLKGLQLPEVSVETEEGQFRIDAEGRWPDVGLWETLVLSTVNELYYDVLVGPHASAWPKEGIDRFQYKCEFLGQEKYRGAPFIEFGTRRRFQRGWQEYVVEKLAIKKRAGLLPGFVGTSNVHLARKFELPPIGTFAHEMFMVYSGIYRDSDESLRDSHNRVLRDWHDRYGDRLSVALTDTYGSDFFFRDMTADQAAAWKGLRHDSGNPFEFAREAERFYRGHGIDPKTKTIVFSDGLTMEKICALYLTFKDTFSLSFGWGTNLTNDMGYRPLSLVMKATEADGHPTVKLSDNPAKATGPEEEVERFMRIFGHTEGRFEKCIY